MRSCSTASRPGFCGTSIFSCACGSSTPPPFACTVSSANGFTTRHDWLFDLKEFAYDHIGLGRNYEGGTQIARKLQPAIAELESVGFLEPLSEEDRFPKMGRDWSIRFVQKSPAPLAVLPGPGIEPAADLSISR